MERVTINGVSVDSAPDEILVLSCGRSELRRAKGRDWLRALRFARKQRDSNLNLFALIAEVATIDGRPVSIQQLERMPIMDVMALQASVAKYFPDRADEDSNAERS